jgi:hypothetical protein
MNQFAGAGVQGFRDAFGSDEVITAEGLALTPARRQWRAALPFLLQLPADETRLSCANVGRTS